MCARWCVVAALAAGCGGRATYPVEGSVVWADDGAPAKELAGGMVQFELDADAPKDAVSPRGAIRDDGTFRLTTFADGDGAPAGRYRVLVVPLVWTEGMLGEKKAPPPALDPRFRAFATSGLTATVEPKANAVELRVGRVRKGRQ